MAIYRQPDKFTRFHCHLHAASPRSFPKDQLTGRDRHIATTDSWPGRLLN